MSFKQNMKDEKLSPKMVKKSKKEKKARRLERASSLPQMDLLTVDGELRRLDLTDDEEEDRGLIQLTQFLLKTT